MALTGRSGRAPLGPPSGFVERVQALGDRLCVDGLALLGERAAIAGLTRGGDVSCGGATRLLPAAGGWMALALARDEDLELVPALVEDDAVGEPWAAVAVHASRELVERALLLGLPVAWLPAGPHPASTEAVAGHQAAERAAPQAGHRQPSRTTGADAEAVRARGVRVPAAESAPAPAGGPHPSPRTGASAEAVTARGVRGPAAGSVAFPDEAVRVRSVPGAAPAKDPGRIRVVDLSSLWAGPLCGSLLAARGADVVKVESTRRPDGARQGPAAFFDLLNAGKASVALDLTNDAGRADLVRVLLSADVVIEASRPRALEQLGIDRRAIGAQVWVSLTGHGRDGDGRDRVAFGDDAAVAGGLVSWDDEGPCFCVDAVADPLSGMVAADAVLDALGRGGRWLVDVAMAGVAAALAGPTLAVPDGVEAAPPRSRPAAATARPLGADTAAVLATLPP